MWGTCCLWNFYTIVLYLKTPLLENKKATLLSFEGCIIMKLFLLLAFNPLILFQILDARFIHEASKLDGNADRKALLVFKSQVFENNRVALVSWNDSTPFCQWKGVACGRKHKRVTALDLGGLELGGIISPAIGNLSFLRSLNLGENSFSGTIPKEVGMLFRLV